MKGVLRKTNRGWFVESFTISDSPPFFNVLEYPVRHKFWNLLKEGSDVDFIFDIEFTPVGTNWYADIEFDKLKN